MNKVDQDPEILADFRALMIACPQCDAEFPLSDALYQRIEHQFRLKIEYEYHESELASKAAMDREIENLRRTTEREAEQKVEAQLKGLEQQVQFLNEKVRETDAKELELLKMQSELELKERRVVLEVERRITEERLSIREQIEKELLEKHQKSELMKEEELRQKTTRFKRKKSSY